MPSFTDRPLNEHRDLSGGWADFEQQLRKKIAHPVEAWQRQLLRQQKINIMLRYFLVIWSNKLLLPSFVDGEYASNRYT